MGGLEDPPTPPVRPRLFLRLWEAWGVEQERVTWFVQREQQLTPHSSIMTCFVSWVRVPRFSVSQRCYGRRHPWQHELSFPGAFPQQILPPKKGIPQVGIVAVTLLTRASTFFDLPHLTFLGFAKLFRRRHGNGLLERAFPRPQPWLRSSENEGRTQVKSEPVATAMFYSESRVGQRTDHLQCPGLTDAARPLRPQGCLWPQSGAHD